MRLQFHSDHVVSLEISVKKMIWMFQKRSFEGKFTKKTKVMLKYFQAIFLFSYKSRMFENWKRFSFIYIWNQYLFWNSEIHSSLFLVEWIYAPFGFASHNRGHSIGKRHKAKKNLANKN